jgi:hypothetical protein
MARVGRLHPGLSRNRAFRPLIGARAWPIPPSHSSYALLFRYSRETWGWTMNRFEQSVPDDDIYISEEVIARLHGAAENTVLEFVAAFQANQRASLAMHCYRKSHLRETGLTIASTCDLTTLVHVCGQLRGQMIFAQARAHTRQPRKELRPAISIACSAGGTYPPLVDVDDTPNCEQAVLA